MREQSISGKKGPLLASHSFKVLEFNQNIKKVEIQVQLKQMPNEKNSRLRNFA